MKCILCECNSTFLLKKIQNNLYKDIYLCETHHKFYLSPSNLNEANFLIIDDKILFNDRFSDYELKKFFNKFDERFEIIHVNSSIKSAIFKEKIDKNKIYKYAVLAGMADYLLDLKIENITMPIDVNELVDYFAAYILEEKALKYIFNSKDEKKTIQNKDKTLKDNKKFLNLIKTKMLEFPIRYLLNCSIFSSNDLYYNQRNIPKNRSRQKDSFATFVNFLNPDNIDFKTYIYSVLYSCNAKINTIFENNENTINKGRNGQEYYRRKLINRYNGCCAICGENYIPVLVASHSKPWRKCSSYHEKTSEYNGLLLCSNHDKLFDQGYISIDCNSKNIIIHESVSSSLKVLTPTKFDHEWSNQMNKYFQYHYEHIYKRNK